jgi:hypothetical protein
MIHKLAALFVATLIAVTSVPAFVYAQNATATTNTTTTETNMTIPVENNTATQLPVFPDEGLQGDENLTTPVEPQVCPPLCGNETNTSPGNQTQSRDNATKVIGLLDDAQLKIDEARNLIRALQAQIQAGQEQPGAATNDTEEIIQEANDSSTDITDIVETNITDSEIIADVGNLTEDIEQAINDTIQSNPNATIDNIENITDEALEAVENVTDSTDNSTIEVAIDNAMIRLLSGLVAAQDYNAGLTTEDRDDLKANLQDAIAELSSDAADSLR